MTGSWIHQCMHKSVIEGKCTPDDIRGILLLLSSDGIGLRRYSSLWPQLTRMQASVMDQLPQIYWASYPFVVQE